MIRTYKCRVKLSKSGHEALSRIFGMCVTLYNACLEERVDCYKKTRKSRTYYDQCKALTEVRADDPEYADISVQVFRGVVGRIDKAYKSFFRRMEKKEKAGFPRFKSSKRWRTIEINDQCWQMLRREGNKLITLLNEKAERAGIKVKVVEMDPKGTSQECSSCGATVKKSLSVRVHKCSCGYEADRDVNAALNILHRGLASVTGGKLDIESRVAGGMREKRSDVGPARPRTVEVTV